MGELAPCFWNGSVVLRVSLTLAIHISCLNIHSDPTRAIVVTGVLHCVWSELPHQGSYLQDYS